ncbi:MAG: Fe2+-dependent dioxygenase [Rhodospirillales bacterium]|nr:Fe2+-dependent dioxygenase [Rhodospirillales bacterium]
MTLHVPALLGSDALAFVDRVLAEARWTDGGRTAGAAARGTKRNLELDPATHGARELQELVHGALAAHPLIADHVLPLRFSRPIVARYEPGMEYGLHVDNPLLGGAAGMMRTDVSVTVFLSDPADYDGGELVLAEGAAEHRAKLARGDAFAYATGTPHRVAPVTRGARIVAVCWIQSVIPDAGQRAIASALHRVHHALVAEAPNTPTTELFLEGYYNLMRLWARP